MTIIALQCRLASTRLPNKAIRTLGDIEIIRWSLRTLKTVVADEYWVACDDDSFSVLSTISKEEGWNCFKGPSHDVLERYCLLAKKTGATTILRATADNPFLFADAAQETLEKIKEKSCDYFSFTGLPHGSGVEAFLSQALFKARDITSKAYDHEHVGPALYNYPEKFDIVFEEAPLKWTHKGSFASYRTTIDTYTDLKKAQRIHSYLQENGCIMPYSSTDIFKALDSKEVQKNILFVPAVKNGRGTGHIRRILHVSSMLKKNYSIFSDILLIDEVSQEAKDLIEHYMQSLELSEENIISKIAPDADYTLIITDAFMLEKEQLKQLVQVAPIVAIDEGSNKTNYFDYIINIIPPLNDSNDINDFRPQLLDLPVLEKKKITSIKKILVSIGGEDPSHFTSCIISTLKRLYSKTDVCIDSTSHGAIPNLKHEIGKYDLVITHYGLTAFEAANAGCAVITVATSSIHKKLSRKYGLVCIEKKDCTEKKLQKVLSNFEPLLPRKLQSIICTQQPENLTDYINSLVYASSYSCPVCGKSKKPNPVIFRDVIKTIKKCSSCSLLYVSFCLNEEKEYTKDYFFDDYKAQYGKTYLEDFDFIKAQGVRRIENITALSKPLEKARLLDVGCAYGPFLSAAFDKGFEPFGIDVSEDAVSYVTNQLQFFARVSDFSEPFSLQDFLNSTITANDYFDAITMWYVIEHFINLDTVFKNISKSLKLGGVFAFSTPNANGVSRRTQGSNFFKESPFDHISLFEEQSVKNIVNRYGFKIIKVLSTGIHPNRFPEKLQKVFGSTLIPLAKIMRLGDTFEVYCIKIKEI